MPGLLGLVFDCGYFLLVECHAAASFNWLVFSLDLGLFAVCSTLVKCLIIFGVGIRPGLTVLPFFLKKD